MNFLDFSGFLDFWPIWTNFLFLGFIMDFWIFKKIFLEFLDFFWTSLIFWNILKLLVFFWISLIFWNIEIFGFFWIFVLFLGIPFKITKVTTKSYQGYYWAPKTTKNGPKQHNKLSFFAWRAKKASTEGLNPSAGARSRPS